MAEIVRQISERLVKKGHYVVVATSKDINRYENEINGVIIKEFDIHGNLVSGIYGESEKYIKYLSDEKFDIITNFAAQQWATDLVLPILKKLPGKKVFVPTGYSAFNLPQYQVYYKKLEEWLFDYDQIVYLSNDFRDINFARKLGLNNGIVITNGASKEEFIYNKSINFRNNLGIPEENLLILHVSGYIGEKGHIDAIKIFTKSKIKNATLLFISPAFQMPNRFNFIYILKLINLLIKGVFKDHHFLEIFQIQFYRILLFLRISKRNIKFISVDRANTVEAFKNADLFLFPSHNECSPIVFFECMASKTPFLTTDVGNAKEIINWCKSGVILPTLKEKSNFMRSHPIIKDSSKILIELASDPEKREMMAKSGYQTWLKKFTWEQICEQYENAYKKLYEK
ncbi:MAG: glycosyltransferase family 4 protein [Anaerolineaceae bacterium]